MKKLQSYPGVKLLCSISFFFALTVTSNAQFTDSVALLIVADDAAVTLAETAIEERLLGMGFSVNILGQVNATDAAAEGMSLILISATVTSGTIVTNMPGLKALEIPIINWEPGLYDDLGFQETGGGEFSGSEIQIVNDSHPLAGGFAAGPVAVATAAKGISIGAPQGEVTIIAVNSLDTAQVAIFAYEKNAAMFLGNAAARRVATFLLNDVADGMTEEGWILFDSSVTWAMGAEVTTSVKRNDGVARQFTLYNNYPNPFNPMTTIPYSIHSQTNVRLSIYNVLGEKIETLVDGIKPAGSYTATFQAHGISSGVYFYKLEAGFEVAVKRLVLLK